MTITRAGNLTFFLIFLTLNCFSQGKLCIDDPYYSKLDFWIGEWEVFNHEGQKVGNNSISKILKNCAIKEQWVDARGSKGESLFYVDNNDGKWHQIWVTENAKAVGGQKHKVLVEEIENGGVIFQGQYFYKGKRIEDRTILIPKSDHTVEQRIERSHDGGKSWNLGFLGIYKPVGTD